ncbi:twin-arginine translocation signal domain-containing protein [Halobaculum magnesiiphilum]|uniref:Uncharacterized protein n=1 Tax=Halobaculum magnesiiphilum TaxID=1017351 RepID=A0A8T8WHP3_9EURY|nr:twin-arginine translocation signal domain-containing protein [Halobaculum magnesiiphilum]QZP39379.1 hypothetical protein K6T50_15835 [Halobaculum magnesiiphilum]
MRRRTFLRTGLAVGVTATLAGCSNNAEDGTKTGSPTGTATDTATETASQADETTTAEETADDSEVDRPANYRWDMVPGRNNEIRSRLGQYAEESVGGVVQNHPAFEYSTSRDVDNQSIDFEGLKLFRDATFDLMANDNPENPMEQMVQAYVDEDLFTDAKTGGFFAQHDLDAPTQYDAEGWLNAETVADSLDYGHNLAVAITWEQANRTPDTVEETAAVIREAYKRHHDFDVLAWATTMGSRTREDINDPTGLLYSPDDDTLRNFNFDTDEGNGEDSRQMHAPIEEWSVIQGEGPSGESRYHPLLFHTDRRMSGQASDFMEAKEIAANTVRNIASGPTPRNKQVDLEHNYSMTTGMTEQLSRTLLEYNSNDADFEDVWNLASVIEDVRRRDGNYIFDTADQNDDYSGFFDGGFAVYEVEDDSVINEVWQDEAGQYDNFGQVYDELAAV